MEGLGGLDAVCAQALREHACASLSLAVAVGDEVVLARAYGLADVGARRAATPETVYGLASVTKAFTSTAVCLAADEGLVDLDAPVPGDFGQAAPTPRQLLLHRGGFPAFYHFHYGDGPLPIDVDRYRRLVRAPGTEFEYANLGYHELGLLLESATGRDLGGLLRERVAAPLGLESFGFGPLSPEDGARVATRYTPDGRAYPVCRTPHPAASAGWATASDVARFARRAHRLLAPATATAMHDAVPINAHTGYGLGRIVSRGPAGPVVRSHGGGMGGIAAMMIEVPERELGVAVLANSTDKGARDAVVAHLMGALVPGFRPEQLTVATDRPRPCTLPPGSWSGRIDTPEGPVPLALRVLVDAPPDGVRLEIRLADAPPVTVRATASDRWDLRGYAAALQLPTADARVNSPALGLELRLTEGGLTGRATAAKDGDRDGLLGSYLVHSCTLLPG